ncbi:MAG: hypothetical protein IJT46_01840 [Bacteroidaceae bacterium]|nr:hypothetical protein [Bacteroidaceae bacterium]
MSGQVTNFGRFYGLLKLMPGMDKDELKQQLVSQWTCGRTESLREMTQHEYHKMCDHLEYTLREQGNNDKEAFKALRRHKRSICLRLLQKIGVDTTEWNAVNSYCKSPKIAGKVFGDLSLEELDELSLKLRIILKKKKEEQ